MTASKPTYWTALNIDPGASKQKIVAAYRKLAKELHPDNGNGESKLFTLVTAAYNVLKANPQHVWGARGDASWQRDYIAATARSKAEKTANKWGIAPRGKDESADDYRRRYAREAQKARYESDPDYAAKRRESSVRSHAKKRAADKAAKNSAPASA